MGNSATMKNLKTPITAIRSIARDFYELRFAWNATAGLPRAGQFLTVRAAPTSVPLLRRPFAFSGYSSETGEAALIFQKKGPGTDIMAGFKPGDILDCIGPLGNSFGDPAKGSDVIIVAGGVGLGPMLFLADRFVRQGQAVIVVFGARTATLVPDLFEAVTGYSPEVCTDDGSVGHAGTVIDYLRTVTVKSPAQMYCCGPGPMLKGCYEFARERGIGCEVSVEQIMACGVGACMGCVVETVNGFARACKDGPVFKGEDLLWT